MKVVLQHHVRLGDIVRIFPLAAHLARGGKTQVFIECQAKFASILKLIDYAEWKDPADPLADKEGKPLYDAVYRLHIWPEDAHRYRTENPPRRWLDFVAARYPEDFRGLKKEIVFTQLPPLDPILTKYRIPREYSLACPAGFTDMVRGDRASLTPVHFDCFETWLQNVVKPRGAVFYLKHPGWLMNRRFVCVEDLAELATLIAHAMDFATILSAPAVIAGARVGKEPLRESWHYVSPINARERLQDDIVAKEQIRWEVALTGHVPQIVPQKR